MKTLIAGNWKMYGGFAAAAEIRSLVSRMGGSAPEATDVLICPPFPFIAAFASEFSDEGVEFGGQDCHAKATGAHTGDVSAEMLVDCGASYVIVGHSERRADHGETDAVVNAKAQSALRAGLTPIICVGETEAQRDAGKALEVVGAQLAGSIPDEPGEAEFVIAYEPVWAIGTGRTPSLAEIEEVHDFIRMRLGGGVRILYGGSVKPGNARDILAVGNVNGALVGGASLKAEDFFGIIAAAKR